MQYLERWYENTQHYKEFGKPAEPTKALHLEIMAFEDEDGKNISEGPGYYYRAVFVIWDLGCKREISPQVSGNFAKYNYNEQSGWMWGYHNFSLKKMYSLLQNLEGFKPLSEEHKKLIKDYLDYLQTSV